MSVLKRWTGTEWETIGMGASLDINGFSAVASINGKTGTVVLGPGDIAYSSSATYSNNSIGKTVSDLVTNTTPIILTGESLFPQVVAALNSGRPVYAEVENVRHYLIYKYLQATGGTMQAIFAAVTGSNISIVTYKDTGMTRTTTSVADSNYQATFGTTTSEEISTAVANHKNVQCKVGNIIYTLVYNDATNKLAIFNSTFFETNVAPYWLYNYTITCENSVWNTFSINTVDGWSIAYDASESPIPSGYVEDIGDYIYPTDTVAGKLYELDVRLNKVWQWVYPIGAVYISYNSTSPAEIFGGSWTKIEGKFLLAADNTYTGGSTGGSAQVTLTSAQLPSISGSLRLRVAGSEGNTVIATERSGIITTTIDSTANGNKIDISAASGGNKYSQNVRIAFGSNSAHNNMPPYLAVYMWRRTA